MDRIDQSLDEIKKWYEEDKKNRTAIAIGIEVTDVLRHGYLCKGEESDIATALCYTAMKDKTFKELLLRSADIIRTERFAQIENLHDDD